MLPQEVIVRCEGGKEIQVLKTREWRDVVSKEGKRVRGRASRREQGREGRKKANDRVSEAGRGKQREEAEAEEEGGGKASPPNHVSKTSHCLC